MEIKASEMDVFAITCHKHLCYIEAGGNDAPYCPVAYAEDNAFAGAQCKSEWFIFKSDNHHMILNEAVATFFNELEYASRKLKKVVHPVPSN